jgi:hypothetical protein
MKKDIDIVVPYDQQTLPALPPFEAFEECQWTSPLGYTTVTHKAYVSGPFEICPDTSKFQHGLHKWRAIIHTKDGTVLNVCNSQPTKEDCYDFLMSYMKHWKMHRNPNLGR